MAHVGGLVVRCFRYSIHSLVRSYSRHSTAKGGTWRTGAV